MKDCTVSSYPTLVYINIHGNCRISNQSLANHNRIIPLLFDLYRPSRVPIEQGTDRAGYRPSRVPTEQGTDRAEYHLTIVVPSSVGCSGKNTDTTLLWSPARAHTSRSSATRLLPLLLHTLTLIRACIRSVVSLRVVVAVVGFLMSCDGIGARWHRRH